MLDIPNIILPGLRNAWENRRFPLPTMPTSCSGSDNVSTFAPDPPCQISRQNGYAFTVKICAARGQNLTLNIEGDAGLLELKFFFQKVTYPGQKRYIPE